MAFFSYRFYSGGAQLSSAVCADSTRVQALGLTMPLRAEFRAFSTLPRDLSSVKFGILNSQPPGYWFRLWISNSMRKGNHSNFETVGIELIMLDSRIFTLHSPYVSSLMEVSLCRQKKKKKEVSNDDKPLSSLAVTIIKSTSMTCSFSPFIFLKDQPEIQCEKKLMWY